MDGETNERVGEVHSHSELSVVSEEAAYHGEITEEMLTPFSRLNYEPSTCRRLSTGCRQLAILELRREIGGNNIGCRVAITFLLMAVQC